MEKADCAENIEVFAKHVFTRDEHAQGDESVKPFPTREQKEYVWSVLDTINKEQLIAIEKSRQLMVTWLVCLYCLWMAKFQKNRLIFIQSKKELDAANLVFNSEWTKARISYMEYHLPEELKSNVIPSYGQLFFKDTGSQIVAGPEGGDQIRSYTCSLIVADEAAFQPEFEEAWRASNPSIKGGGKFICVSTPKSGSFMKKLIQRA